MYKHVVLLILCIRRAGPYSSLTLWGGSDDDDGVMYMYALRPAPEDLNHGRCCKSQSVTQAMVSPNLRKKSIFVGPRRSDPGDEVYATSVLNHLLDLESPPSPVPL